MKRDRHKRHFLTLWWKLFSHLFFLFFSIVTEYLHCNHFQKIVEYSTGLCPWFSPSPNIEGFHVKKTYVYFSHNFTLMFFIFLQTQRHNFWQKMMSKCTIKVLEILTN